MTILRGSVDVSSLRRIVKIVVSLLPVVLLAGCGGGSNGGFTGTENTLSVKITPTDGDNTMAWNPTLQTVAANQPYTKSITVEVFDQNGQYYPAPSITVTASPANKYGDLYVPSSTAGSAPQDAGSSAVLSQTSGVAGLFFVSGNLPGTVTLTATVTDPASKRQVSASMQLQVVGNTQPVSSLTFTGPYVNAVLSGSFSTALNASDSKLSDGSYSRVLSVVASDASGNPPQVGTEIDFAVVDAPVTGFPANGAGSFAIAGSDGDPLEDGYDFYAQSGQFMTKGVLPGDQLVLDGINFNQPANRLLTGIRTVASVSAENALSIDSSGHPFNANNGADTGPTVPYIVGNSQGASILASSTTDDTGVATTLLTYPASELGKTAVVIACTVDQKVCTVLNTCDNQGTHCGSMFLPVNTGTGLVLTVSTTQLLANSSTPLTLCLKDSNNVPVQAAGINYNITSNLGSAIVTIGGSTGLAGTLVTSSDGCVTTTVVSQGQQTGSNAITIAFQANGVQKPVDVTIASPGAGTLTSTMTCDSTTLQNIIAYNAYQKCVSGGGTDCGTEPSKPDSIQCKVALRLTDSQGGAVPGSIVSTTITGLPLLGLSFSPAYSSTAGLTDADGATTATLTFSTSQSTTVKFSAGATGGATTSVTTPILITQ